MKKIAFAPLMALPLTLAAAFSGLGNFVAIVAIVCFIAEMFKAAAQEKMVYMVTDFIVSFTIVIVGFVVTANQTDSEFVASFAWIVSMILATADVLVGTIIKMFKLQRDFGPISG